MGLGNGMSTSGTAIDGCMAACVWLTWCLHTPHDCSALFVAAIPAPKGDAW